MFTPNFFLNNNRTIFENSFYTHFFCKKYPVFLTNLHFYLLSGMGSPGAGRNPQNFKNLRVTPNKIVRNLVETSTPNSEKYKFLVAQAAKVESLSHNPRLRHPPTPPKKWG